MKFRPCIDLHEGKVKQIVGSTLQEGRPDTLRTNFTAAQPPSHFASLYAADGLAGGHVIMLGAGNEAAAAEALAAYPGGLQLGGGITVDNAGRWLDAGAAQVIVTSHVFKDGQVFHDRLAALVKKIGRERLVIDLSCRKRDHRYYVVTDRWQKFTDVAVSPATLDFFASHCAEFLIHAADVEGKCAGIAVDLAADLGRWVSIPTTYAGGIRGLEDLLLLEDVGSGRLDFTIGSSLDIFGGTGITYAEAVSFHRSRQDSAGA